MRGSALAKKQKGDVTQTPDPVERYQAIGKFVAQFSQLEHTIRYLLADLLELNLDQLHIVASSYDFAMLCRVTSAFIVSLPQCDDETKKRVDATFKRCHQINDNRAKLVHAKWDEAGAQHVSRGTLKPNRYFAGTDEIVQLSEDAKKAMNLVIELIEGNATEWARELRDVLKEARLARYPPRNSTD